MGYVLCLLRCRKQQLLLFSLESHSPNPAQDCSGKLQAPGFPGQEQQDLVATGNSCAAGAVLPAPFPGKFAASGAAFLCLPDLFFFSFQTGSRS